MGRITEGPTPQQNIFIHFTDRRQTKFVWLDFDAKITPSIDLPQVRLDDTKKDKLFLTETGVSSTSHRSWRSVAKVGKVEPDSTLSIAPTPCAIDHRRRRNQHVFIFLRWVDADRFRPPQTITNHTETRLNSTSYGRRSHKTTNFSISFSVNLDTVLALEFKSRKRCLYPTNCTAS